jgi:hypothetical protein
VKAHAVLEIEREPRDEAGEEHEEEQPEIEMKLQHHVEAHDHVQRVQHDAVADAIDIHEDLDVLPKREIDPVKEQRNEQREQRRTRYEGHDAVTPECGLH